MGHYITGFAIYTLAMIGLLFFAMFIYKKFSLTGFNIKKQGFLKIEDALGLSARKTLYIVKAGDEKFLIAADLDRTTLIAKLKSNCTKVDEKDTVNYIEESDKNPQGTDSKE